MSDAKLTRISNYRSNLPDNYDPDEGLAKAAEADLTIHLLTANWRRVKDVTKLNEAVEAKLGEQRRFVLWWDEQEKSDAKRKMRALQTGNAQPELATFALDRITVHRWRTRLEDPRKFDVALEAAQERCRRICEAEKGATDQRGASGTGENEWYTPERCLKAARAVMGAIDLDPASSDQAQEIVKATRHFTREQDGLAQSWHGRVWLNPPYAQPDIANFVSKMTAEWRSGNVDQAIMLTHNYTDTSWFHEAASASSAICFTRGRIKFYDRNGTEAAPTQGQAFFYFGEEILRFAEVFCELGFIVMPWQGEVN